MIEALSTMLDAAVGRDGRSQAPLSEELKYVDAYLYITKERLGERLTVSREIEKSMLGCQIPRLMHSSNTNLQPESIFFSLPIQSIGCRLGGDTRSRQRALRQIPHGFAL